MCPQVAPKYAIGLRPSGLNFRPSTGQHRLFFARYKNEECNYGRARGQNGKTLIRVPLLGDKPMCSRMFCRFHNACGRYSRQTITEVFGRFRAHSHRHIRTAASTPPPFRNACASSDAVAIFLGHSQQSLRFGLSG